MEVKIPIVFLHGWVRSTNDWLDNLTYFKNKGYPTFAPKMPGFELPNPPKTWGVPDYAKFVEKEVQENFPGQQIVLVGHSLGGRVAIYLSSTHPELVRGLVLTNSAGLNLEPLLLRHTLIAVSKIAENFEQTPIIALVMNLPRNILRNLIGSKGYQRADRVMRKVFKNVVNLDLRDRLVYVICPTLIIWGDKDTTTPLKMAREFHKRIKDSELAIIEGAGHLCHITHSVEWNNHVAGFISRL